MSFEFFLLYSVTVFVASIVPGPSMLLALTHGRRYGPKRTIASALGNVSITLLQAAISIAGLGTILLASEGLFDIIKWIGSSYLIYMGLSIWCSPNLTVSEKPSNHLSSKAPLRKMYI
jgi:threonine/homoserine/homoserine lactone efflux protein